VGFIGKIKNRFLVEYQALTTENSLNFEIGTATNKVYNIGVKQAWTQEKFQPNDYFAGFPLRVYQIRIFKEMLLENPIFFNGFGLNAAQLKIKEKQVQHNLYEEYGEKNFHNEYIQLFAELGIIGLILLLLMLGLNLKNALQSKDFIHISFAVLMISLFLTESFLSRQRGIVFFTIMYCLFNSKEIFRIDKKTN
jgi:O-antigen ligase